MAALDRHHDSAFEASFIITRLLGNSGDPPVAMPEVGMCLLCMGAVSRLSHILRPVLEDGDKRGIEHHGKPCGVCLMWKLAD